jgi:hypothetical protein
MKHDPIELLARLAHVHATGEAGERIPGPCSPWSDARPGPMKRPRCSRGSAGRPTRPIPRGLTAPADIAAAAEALIDAWERGEAATGETMARGMPLVMALLRSGSEGTP